MCNREQLNMKDYYQILEVPPDAPQDMIKEQYRFLVHAWHPDKFPNPAQKIKAEEKIKEINTAYEILRNPAKRAEYDRNSRLSRLEQEQKYRRQEEAKAAQRRAEDERRKREEAAHQKEEKSRKDRANRERVVAGSVKVFVPFNGRLEERIVERQALVGKSVTYTENGELLRATVFLRDLAAVEAAVRLTSVRGWGLFVKDLRVNPSNKC
jgi:curved DNA-binding protein CbpA